MRNRIWSKTFTVSRDGADSAVAYPEHAVLGPAVLDVPAEELFFFVVQTYIVSLRHPPPHLH